MAKFLVLVVMCFFVQFSYAINEMEAFNTEIRVQLDIYDKLQKEPDSVYYIDDLYKLGNLTESALKAKSIDEKDKILSATISNISPEFDNWLSQKAEEPEISAYAENKFEFYHSLLKDHAELEADIKTSGSSLENLLKDIDLDQKQIHFSGLGNTFSAYFQDFMLDQLKAKAEFFEKLLNDKDIKFAKEIQQLKAKTIAALAANSSIDEKSQVLNELRFTGNEKLDVYLYNKNIEYSEV